MEYEDDVILGFINDRGASGFPHLRDVRSLWGDYGLSSLPSWATIDADGTINSGSGTMPRSVLNGDWIG
ncbi:MAG: hypothetical protein AAF531_12180 [Actinomycetota bacterium]